jgi:hypothetical protein
VTAIDPATCWVPVPVRWRYVQPGDVIAGNGQLYQAASSYPSEDRSQWVIMVTPGALVQIGDPDEMVSILVPVPERDARSLVLEDLATHVIGRRTVGAA